MENIYKKPPGCLMGGGCLAIFGVAFASFFALGLVGLTIDEKDEPLALWLFIIFMILVGVFCLFWGFLQRKQTLIHTSIIDIIANQGHTSVESIGMLIGETNLGSASKKIQAVINKGYLPGYTLDPYTNRVTLYDPDNPPIPQEPWPMAFECRACGAKNRVMTTDGTANCEYCGSPHINN